MSQSGNSGIGRIYIKVGSDIIDLTGTAKEVQEDWLKIKDEDSWEGKLLAIKNARDSAVQIAAQRAVQSGIPERGSAFRRVLDSCEIEKTGDVILAAIHYLRFVEKETNTPPRELKNLVSQSGNISATQLTSLVSTVQSLNLTVLKVGDFTADSQSTVNFILEGADNLANGDLAGHVIADVSF